MGAKISVAYPEVKHRVDYLQVVRVANSKKEEELGIMGDE